MKKIKKIFKFVVLGFLIFVIIFIIAGTCKRKVSALELKNETISIYNNWNSPRVMCVFALENTNSNSLQETYFLNNDTDYMCLSLHISGGTYTIYNYDYQSGHTIQKETTTLNYYDFWDDMSSQTMPTLENLLLILSVTNAGDTIYNLATWSRNSEDFEQVRIMGNDITGILPKYSGVSTSAKVRVRTNDIFMSGLILFDAGFNNSISNVLYFINYLNSNYDFTPNHDFSLNSVGELRYWEGYDLGDYFGYDRGLDEGYDLGYDVGYIKGYSDGEQSENAVSPVFNLLTGVFEAIGAIFAIELVPNIPLGVFILVPLFFAVVGVVLWIWRRN